MSVRHPVLRDSSWLQHGGGLIYHARALRHRRLWRNFIEVARDWQDGWRADAQSLVIIGPSAGYTLSLGMLARFNARSGSIVALEPDPLARWLLRKRFAALNWQFESIDVFAPGGLQAIAQRFPTAALLFSNVIGQHLQHDVVHAQQWRAQLHQHLANHHWASYHDVISTECIPLQAAARFRSDTPLSLEGLLANFWPGGELALTDHNCLHLGPQPAHYALWSITPRQHHLIEWTTHAPGAAP